MHLPWEKIQPKEDIPGWRRGRCGERGRAWKLNFNPDMKSIGQIFDGKDISTCLKSTFFMVRSEILRMGSTVFFLETALEIPKVSCAG